MESKIDDFFALSSVFLQFPSYFGNQKRFQSYPQLYLEISGARLKGTCTVSEKYSHGVWKCPQRVLGIPAAGLVPTAGVESTSNVSEGYRQHDSMRPRDVFRGFPQRVSELSAAKRVFRERLNRFQMWLHCGVACCSLRVVAALDI